MDSEQNLVDDIPNYATRRFSIDPGGSLQVARSASFLACLEASFPFRITIDDQPESEFEQGLTYRPKNPFLRTRIINPSDVDVLDVQLGFGKGNVSDARLNVLTSLEVTGIDDLRSDVQALAGEIDLGQSFYLERDSAGTFMASNINTTGILIEYLYLGVDNSGLFHLVSDPGPQAGRRIASARNGGNVEVRNIILPAGNGLTLIRSSGAGSCHMHYRLL